MLTQPCLHLLAETVSHLRDASFLGEVGQREGGQRGVLGRLDDAGAPGGERRADLPRDHSVGKVPGRDHGRHADGLLHDHDLLCGCRGHDDLEFILTNP